MPPSSLTQQITVITREVSGNQWIFHISSTDAALINSDYTKLKVNTDTTGIVSPWESSNWCIYSGETVDPFGTLWKISDNGSGDWSIDFTVDTGEGLIFFSDINKWSFIIETIIAPPSNIPPIVIQWSGAFDIDSNIVRYELSYQTSGSWKPLPYVVSSLTSGSYTFTPLEQANHKFRIRIVDSFNTFSTYKYFDYIISSDYKISTNSSTTGGETLCGIAPASTFTTSIFLSNNPPTAGVIVYTDSGKTNTFNGLDEYWLIKSPTGVLYSCLISGGLSSGLITEVHLCGSINGLRSQTGRSNALATCSDSVSINVYWENLLGLGSKLYTDSSYTTPFLGNQQFFIIEYSNVEVVVKVGDISDPSVVVSKQNKFDTCAMIVRFFRSNGSLTDGNLCGLVFQTDFAAPGPNFYIKYYDSINDGVTLITNADPAYAYNDENATTIFQGGDKYYKIQSWYNQLSGQVTGQVCKIANDGLVTIVGNCDGGTYLPLQNY
jgi:hypothetical protein